MEKSEVDGNVEQINHEIASSSSENKMNQHNPRETEVSTVSSIRNKLSTDTGQPFKGKRKDPDSSAVMAGFGCRNQTTKITDHNKLFKTDSASSKESGEVVQLSSVDSTDPVPSQSSNVYLSEKKSSHCKFDLNEGMEGNGAECHQRMLHESEPISVVAKVGVPMGLPKKPLQFGGELGWKKSGNASAFRPTSVKNPERDWIDLNVAATPDDEPSMNPTSNQPQRMFLDLNCQTGPSSFNLNDNPMNEDTDSHSYQQSEIRQMLRKSVASDTVECSGGNMNQSILDMARPSYWVDLSSMGGFSHIQQRPFLVAAPTAEQLQMVVPSGVYIGKVANLPLTYYPTQFNNQHGGAAAVIPQISGSVLAYANMRPASFPNGSVPVMDSGSRGGVSNAEFMTPLPASQINHREMASWN